MKRFLYSVLVVLLCASCDSLLDLEPKNGVTFEHYFTTEQDLEAVVIQMHGNLRTALTGVTQQEFMGLRVDVVKQGSYINKIRAMTCIQQSVMNLGILMVQGLVNSFGAVTMAAFAAAVKIDTVAYLPV